MSGATDSTLTPAPEEQAPVVPAQEPAAPAPPADPDAVELAELEQNAVALPDGDGLSKFVPLSAVTKPREEAKQFRQENKTLKAELERAQAAAAAAAPYVEAAKVILQKQPAPALESGPQGPTAEERAELEEVARDLDFYKTDGSLDLDRAQRHQARVLKAAERIADRKVAEQVGPIQHQAAHSQAQAVLDLAKQWKDPVTGETADPVILANVWNRVASQPGGIEALTNRESAAFIWGQALNYTRWQKQQGGPKTPAPAGPPVFVEPSGGGAAPVTLSSMEKKAARDMGMTEAEYLKAAANAPRG